MSPTASRHTRQLLVGFALFLLLGAGLSAAVTLDGAERRSRDLAEYLARSYFESVVAARKWNALHGGVYVPVTERFQPNPYLADPLRDLTTTSGVQLTKVNPAYMTRLIAGIDEQDHGIRVHITSLDPIRPGNAADPWERAALEAFENGRTRIQQVVTEGGTASFRYMRPLLTRKPCLTCHAKQGYREGDIRGGISVSFSYAPFAAATRQARLSILAAHVAFVLLGGAVIALLGKRLLTSQAELVETRQEVAQLEGILPICCFCKKIRREDGEEQNDDDWVAVEEYVRDRSDAEFSHGICPDCMRTHYPDEDV